MGASVKPYDFIVCVLMRFVTFVEGRTSPVVHFLLQMLSAMLSCVMSGFTAPGVCEESG